MKRPVIALVSIITGWLLGSSAVLALHAAGLNIPASIATELSQYNMYVGAETLVYTISFGWATYQMLARRFLDSKVDKDERGRFSRRARPESACFR